MGQRMRSQKVLCFKQGDQARQSRLKNKVLPSRCVFSKPSPPILLSLTADPYKPLAMGDLSEEAQKNRKPDHLKPPIIKMGPERMDRSTVRTTIPLQPHCLLKPIKKPTDITMTPQSWASASRTPRRTRQRILLAKLLQKLDIDIAIQYQVRSLGGITGDSSPDKDSSPVIPSLSLQLILRRKKTYTINGEILGSLLGRIM